MAKTIKTKEFTEKIKAHDSAVNVGGRIKDVGVKTKEKVTENTSPNDNVSPEQYASDKVTESIRTGTETAAVGTKKVVKKTAEKAKSKIKEKKVSKDEITDNEYIVEHTDKSNTDQKVQKGKNEKKVEQKKADIKQVSKAEIKEKAQPQPNVTNAEKSVDAYKAPKQRKQTPPKTRGKANVKKANTDKGVRKPNSASGKIKQTKRSAENTGKTIKTAKGSVKNTGKTVKTAKSTSKATAETAKRTKQAAQATAKATVKTVKVVGKALVEAGKAVVAGAESIGAAIAAGGVHAIVVVIVICLIGAIGGTCFGIFLANDETTGTDKTMSQAISELTSEHYANLLALRTSYTYDLYEVQGNTSINWKEVLAVYAVKTTSSENPLEVVTLNDEKIDLLREIMKDMNTMTGAVVPRVVAETTVSTDEDGHSVKITTYVTKKVLVVTIAQLNANQIAEVYRMNDEQKAQINELLSEEYDALWRDLIGSNGMIINPNTSYVGTGIFAWPLDGDYTITSYFGTRSDPFTGEIKTHGGTDIAAPLGTPILAAADGTVVTASYDDGGYGFYVKIKHNDTYSTIYGHCSVLHVTTGQTVKQGQLIAEVGSTGKSTGPHLHYEVIQNGVRVDAMWFYTKK